MFLNLWRCGLTRPPFPRQDLTRDTIGKRNGSKAESNKDLGDDEPVDITRPRCNGCTDERDDGRANEQKLAGLERVRGGGDDGAQDCLNQ